MVERVEGPTMTSAYLHFEPRRVAASLAIGVLAVVASAYLAKTAVEGLTSFTYTIHWFETVPLLVLLVAFVANGWLNERAGEPAD